MIFKSKEHFFGQRGAAPKKTAAGSGRIHTAVFFSFQPAGKPDDVRSSIVRVPRLRCGGRQAFRLSQAMILIVLPSTFSHTTSPRLTGSFTVIL